MKIVQMSHTSKVFSDVLHRQASHDEQREAGLHVSTVVQDIQRLLYPKEYGRADISPDQTRTYFELGSAVEDLLAGAISARITAWEKPAPRRMDGMWCSPDGWSPTVHTIDEIKACWKSSRDFQQSPKFAGYLMQAMAYGHVWDASRIRIHVFFVNGDWRPPVPAPPVTFIVRPSSRELAANWQRLVRHAEDRGWL